LDCFLAVLQLHVSSRILYRNVPVSSLFSRIFHHDIPPLIKHDGLASPSQGHCTKIYAKPVQFRSQLHNTFL
jgi:hypothetical protein